MPQLNHFLDFHAENGTSYLHPGGMVLTNALIRELAPVKDLRVLDLGCGTGASIVRLAKHYQTKSVAADFSSKMLRSAKQRAWFNGHLNKINFVKLPGNGLLPFPSNSFDAVYSESVLAIVDENILPILVKEINRVLVPKGKFISNDAIWKDSSHAKDIERINTACLRDFGVLQSVSVPAYKSEWIKLFERCGFESIRILDTKRVISIPVNNSLIDLFIIYKRVALFLNPSMFLKNIKFKRVIKKRHSNDGDFLDSFLFVMLKKG